ncbi:MAG: hypothetical protein V2A55_00190 [Candidatus Jorgensenbacteria bacterium]
MTILVVLLVIGYQLLVTGAAAQTSAQVIMTWQADNFYPADFGGKAPATPGTPLTVSAEVLRSGKLTDLSGASFTWYVDEKLKGRGDGLKEIAFSASESVGDSHFVRVGIQLEDEIFENSIRIPVSSPMVVLESPYLNQLVKSGNKIEVTAVPYFFNVDAFRDLNFFWQVNNGGIQKSGNDNLLLLNIGQAPAGQTIQITGTARNVSDFFETATSRIRLVIY